MNFYHETEGFEEALTSALAELGVAHEAKAVRLCREHFDALREANASTNLTRIDSPEAAARKHYADSLLPLAYGVLKQGARVIDIGAGAGFPGLPLAFFREDITLTLLDSQIKRVNFLQASAEAIKPRVRVLHARAEDAARTELRMAFDALVARALAPLNVLVELALPFLKDGGVALCYKGPRAEDELEQAQAALSRLGGSAEIRERETPWGARTLVIITKRGPVPAAYPRKAGIPQKQPL